MGIVRQRVQKEVGGAVTGEMLSLGHLTGKDESRRIDTTIRCFPAQVIDRDGVVGEQPQTLAIDLLKESASRCEDRAAVSFEAPVEAAETKRSRQSEVRRGWALARRWTALWVARRRNAVTIDNLRREASYRRVDPARLVFARQNAPG